ncbi:MAG: hypothetical protein LCH34_05045 [Firmicutes bacterium]|nr:hypothetical protein [Bacillota bacterium]
MALIGVLNIMAILIVYTHLVAKDRSNQIIRWRVKSRSISSLMANPLRIRNKLKRTEFSKQLYRIYKYLYLQSSSGMRGEDIIKSLHRIIYKQPLKDLLLKMSATVAQTHDIAYAIQQFRRHFNEEDGEMLMSIFETMRLSGLSKEAYMRLDQMMFQKYLIQMGRDTQRIRRLYFYAVTSFIIAACLLLFLPIVDQMMKSAEIIFQ